MAVLKEFDGTEWVPVGTADTTPSAGAGASEQSLTQASETTTDSDADWSFFSMDGATVVGEIFAVDEGDTNAINVTAAIRALVMVYGHFQWSVLPDGVGMGIEVNGASVAPVAGDAYPAQAVVPVFAVLTLAEGDVIKVKAYSDGQTTQTSAQLFLTAIPVGTADDVAPAGASEQSFVMYAFGGNSFGQERFVSVSDFVAWSSAVLTAEVTVAANATFSVEVDAVQGEDPTLSTAGLGIRKMRDAGGTVAVSATQFIAGASAPVVGDTMTFDEWSPDTDDVKQQNDHTVKFLTAGTYQIQFTIQA